MKRRLTAALCALLLFFAFVPAPAEAAWDDGLIFIAANVKMLPLAEFMPITVNGSVYVPVSVFDASVNGGVSLGVFGAMSPGRNSYTMYNINKNLVFDLATGNSFDYLENGTPQDPRALIRNGKIYVTAYAVCDYFKLEYTYRAASSSTYGYPVVRIKSKGSPLEDDTGFINAASTAAMLTVLNDYYRLVVPQPPAATPTPSVTPARPVNPEPGDVNRSDVAFQLVFRFETGEAGAGILDALALEGRTALLFFTPELLSLQDDLVRRAMGEGHSIGLLVPGESVEAAKTAIEEGNRLLSHVGRTRARMILPAGADAATLQTLRDGGWLCWSGGINGVPGGRSGYSTATEIMRLAVEKKSLARVVMDDSSASAVAVASVLRTVRLEKYSFQSVVETSF